MVLFRMKSLHKKLKKKYFSCGDLRIYPIREIRGSNRILYGDEYDNGDWFEESRDCFYHQPTEKTLADEYSKSSPENEPVYSEILPLSLSRSCDGAVNTSGASDDIQAQYENTLGDNAGHRYEKLCHFSSSHPSLKSDSCDSGYRSVSQVRSSVMTRDGESLTNEHLFQEPHYVNHRQELVLFLRKGR